MPYVKRDRQNEITGVYGTMNPGIAEEYLAEDDVEVLAFRDPLTTLDGARAAKIASVNDLRNQKMTADFTHNARTFDASNDVLVVINHAISYGQETSAASVDLMSWTLADNTTVSITWNDFRAMAIALFERNNALHGGARTHKDALLAMTDIAAVEAYDITIGWAA